MKILSKASFLVSYCTLVIKLVFSQSSSFNIDYIVFDGNYYHPNEVRATPGFTAIPMPTAEIKLHIDRSILQNTNYSITGVNLNGTHTIPPIDFSLPVGTIEGFSEVTSSGQATYNIPIPLPPGTRGMSPKLSINYNSGVTAGNLGRGWNLGGLSSISRVRADYYHDRYRIAPYHVRSVHLDSDDVFALDGNRIVGSLANARLENDNFSSIQLIGSSAQYFVVETKDGLKLEYGNSDDSKLILIEPISQLSETLTWYLNKVEDKFGNKIVYNYINIGNEVVIKEIQYGTSTELYNSVKFFYEKRKDNASQYLLNNEMKSELLIKEIEINCEGVFAQGYKFTYGFNGQTYLNEITQIGSDYKKLNPTIISYGESTGSSSNISVINPVVASTTNSLVTNADYISGDYNNDGKSDLVAFVYSSISNDNGLRDYTGEWRLYLNQDDGSNFNEIILPNTLPVNFNPYTFSDFTPELNPISITNNTYQYAWLSASPSVQSRVQYADFDLDGMDDILIVNTASGSTIFTVYYSTGSGFVADHARRFVTNMNNQSLICDLDGDGVPEGIQYTSGISANPAFFIHSFNSTTSWTISDTQIFKENGSNPFNDPYSGFRILDFDGDGISELQTVRNGLIRILKFHLHNNRVSEIYTEALSSEYSQNYYGDFNGDGISDNLKILNPNVSSSPTAKVRLGTGTEFTYPKDFNGTSHFARSKQFFVLDINKDGKSDLLNLKNELSGISVDITYGGHEEYISTTNGDFSGVNFPPVVDYFHNAINYNPDYPYPFMHNTSIDLEPEFLIGDFDGDGLPDIFMKTTNSGQRVIVFINRGLKQHLVTSILNGHRVETKFEYSTLVDGGSSIYTQGAGAIYPLLDAAIPIDVVRSTSLSDGLNSFKTKYFKYEGATIHFEGKGFIGFDKVSETDNNFQTVVEKSFELRLPYYEKVPIGTKTFILPNIINPIYESTTLSTFEPPTSTPYLISPHHLKIDEVVSYDYLTGAIVTKSYEYDLYGNVENEVMINDLETTSIDITYTSAGTWGGILNLPENVTTTITRGNEPPSIREKSYQYDPIKGTLLQSTESPSTIVTINDYDEVTGVLTETYTSAPSCPTCITKNFNFLYDSKSRFVIKETNPLSQTIETTIDPRWGNPLTIKGVDGLTTRNSYDGFGKRFQTTNIDNRTQTIKYEWVQSLPSLPDPLNVAAFALYSKTITLPGSPSTKSYFDLLGREILSEGDGFSDKIYSEKKFDERGNLIGITGNYQTGSVPIISSYIYSDTQGPNLLDQVVSTDNTSHTNSTIFSYSYSLGNTQIITTAPDGTVTYQTTDATGKLVESADDGGVLNYDYFSNGKTKEIRLDNTPWNTMTYDVNNHQTSLWDKDAGLTTYTFDAYGQLTSQVDAKGNVYNNFVYDALGRVRSKVENNNSTYAYDYFGSGEFGVNKIKSITGPGGIKYSYAYDEFSRLVSYKEEGVPGQNELGTNFTYDANSNLLKTIYPGGFTTTNVYNSKSYLIKIENDSKAIWQADEVNSLSQFTKYTLGNGIQTQRVYDNFGFLEEIVAPGIQNLKFEFNKSNGNLKWRRDQTRNITENFQYDQRNRLTESQIGPIINVVDYDPSGGLTQLHKFDVGTYSDYDPNHLNAVLEITNIANSEVSHEAQILAHNAFNSLSSITEGNFTLDLTYGPDQQRRKTDLKDPSSGNIVSTRIFYPNYEKETTGSDVKEIYYINSPTGLSAMYVIENGNQGNFYYVYSDHLGSILTVTDAAGVPFAEQNFDAWGRKRNPIDWDYQNIPSVPSWLYRGFTGHEHLSNFGLINMNGRCYDPILGTMINPDNNNQAPTYSQNYNRYAYAYNNPLKYTDPSGESIWDVVRTIIDISTISARWHNEETAWLNDKINNTPRETGYFKLDYLRGNAKPYPIRSDLIVGNLEHDQFYGTGSNGFTDASNTNLAFGPVAEWYRITRVGDGPWSEPEFDGYKYGWYSTGSNTNTQSVGGCSDCLDYSSIGNNYLGLSYPGRNNPLTRGGDYSYSYVPVSLAEYPAIGHDRRYDRLGISGASGLFLDTRAIGADWRFVAEELSIANNPFINPIDRMSAGILGIGLGVLSFPKTALQLGKPLGHGYIDIMMWYNFSNQGMNNTPSIHTH